MAYTKKSVTKIEAYDYKGNASNPGWPAGWLTLPHTFAPGGSYVTITKPRETVIANTGDFIILLKKEFFVCSPSKFAEEFE